MQGVLKRSNSIIFSAVLNYGIENFSLTILEYCLPDEQFEREDYYIKTLQPKYNILQKAGSSLGYKHSEEAKKRISVFMSSENRPEGAGRPGQKIEVFDKETNLTATFDSFSAAAIALDIRYGAIKNYFYKNQQKPYKGRYIFTKI